MAHPLLEKAAGLTQTKATWHATVRRAPAWITPRNKPPYRPFLILVLEADTDRIRQTNMQDDRPGVEIVLKTLGAAMTNPTIGGGKRVRPARILLDDPVLARAVTPYLAEIGVRCEAQAGSALITAALRNMDAHMNRRPPQPGLLSVKGATQPLVAELFAAAAEYHAKAPWRWLDNLSPLAIHYPADGPARYAVLLGNGGEEFGVALYSSLDDLSFQYTTADHEQIFKKISSLSLTYDEPMALSFDDLDAIEALGWPIAGANAYPLVMKVTPPVRIGLPNAAEIALLAAVLRAIPPLVAEALHADRGLPAATERAYPLPNVHAGQQIKLAYPVDLVDIWSQGTGKINEADLQDLIRDWRQDERSRVFVRHLGAYLLKFMDFLAISERSEKRLSRREGYTWAIGKLTCEYDSFETFSPSILLGGPRYLDEFREKIGATPEALAAYKATWRKLEEYVRAMGYKKLR